ncbi:MAG: response regulator transcription factor, partial [Proteobacteria bacterium]
MRSKHSVMGTLILALLGSTACAHKEGGEPQKINPSTGEVEGSYKAPGEFWSPARKKSNASFYYLAGEYELMNRNAPSAAKLFETAYTMEPNAFVGAKLIESKAITNFEEGLELAKNIREKAKYLVFTTAHPDYALQAFDVQSDQYLLKPISFAKFALGIDRILKKEANNAKAASKDADQVAALYIKGDHKYAFSNIAIDEILYIKALQNYIQIITKTETHTTYLTLKEIEKALENHAFIRVNKSNIVAKTAIKKVDGNIIRLVNNEMIQIGEGYKEA